MSGFLGNLSISFLLSLGLLLIGCGEKEVPVKEKEGAAERAGKNVDRAIAKTGEKMEEAKDAIVDKTKETGEFFSDGYFTSRIKAEILTDPLLKVFQINVKTSNRVVTLSGEVDSDQSIARTLEIVNSVKGVKSVLNELTIKKKESVKEKTDENAETSGEYLSDSYITAKIKAEILSDPLLKSLQINVATTNGKVNLSGVIDSQQIIKRCKEIANSIKGVKSVETELYIKKAE